MNQSYTKLAAQLRDIWKHLGISQKVSVILATAALVAGVASLGLWSSRVQYGLLYGRLSDAEAAKVVAALDEAKVPYKLSGGSISVPADKVHTMRLHMAGRGIPRGDGVGFEIFDKPNFGMTDFVQRANYLRAVQGELARTISQMDEIESARVMITLPENRLLLDKDKHPTASVFVRMRGSMQLQPQSINSIRFMVANAVEGLKPNAISIVDSMGNLLSENTEGDSLVGLTATQLTHRRNVEQYLAKNAQTMLEKVLGPGQAIVRVAAEISFDTQERREEKYDPDGQVVKKQTKNEDTTDSTTAQLTAGVGVSSNTSTETNNAAGGAGPVTKTNTKKNTGDIEYEISKTINTVNQAAGSLKHLSAAVTIAARYEGAGAERKMMPRSTEELEKLRRIVQSAIGAQVGEGTRNDQVTLEELAFNEQFATETVKQLEQQQKHEFWWNLGQKAVYPLLAIGVILIFLRLLKRTPVEEIPLGIPLRQIQHAGNGAGKGNGHGPTQGPAVWRGEPVSDVVTVEVLNQLIKENPGNMTQAIRGWLARGKATTR